MTPSIIGQILAGFTTYYAYITASLSLTPVISRTVIFMRRIVAGLLVMPSLFGGIITAPIMYFASLSVITTVTPLFSIRVLLSQIWDRTLSGFLPKKTVEIAMADKTVVISFPEKTVDIAMVDKTIAMLFSEKEVEVD